MNCGKPMTCSALAVVVHDAYDAITVHDLEARIPGLEPRSGEMYGLE